MMGKNLLLFSRRISATGGPHTPISHHPNSQGQHGPTASLHEILRNNGLAGGYAAMPGSWACPGQCTKSREEGTRAVSRHSQVQGHWRRSSAKGFCEAGWDSERHRGAWWQPHIGGRRPEIGNAVEVLAGEFGDGAGNFRGV